MKLLHLSRTANRDSIAKHGLLPSFIKLDAHYESFKRHGLEPRKCVYTWDSDKGQGTDKYIRDMIYCKLFIHPRNDMSDEREQINNQLWNDGLISDWGEDDHWIDYRKLGTKLYGDSDTYDLYEINIDEKDPLLLQSFWVHGQGCDEYDDHTNTCFMMKDEYAHDDKILHIANDIILPERLKLVTSVKTRVYKNDTIGVSYSKSI